MKFAKKSWFKTIAIAVIFCMVATTGAFAQTNKTTNYKLAEQNEALNSIFGEDNGIAILSDDEMKETEAAWLLQAGGMALSIGYSTYNYYNSTSNRTYGGYAAAALWGAALGTRSLAYGAGAGWTGRIYAWSTNYIINTFRW